MRQKNAEILRCAQNDSAVRPTTATLRYKGSGYTVSAYVEPRRYADVGFTVSVVHRGGLYNEHAGEAQPSPNLKTLRALVFDFRW